MAKPATASNAFDPDTVNNLLGKIDNYDVELLSERGSYMSKCRVLREGIENVFEEAKAKGIPTKELKILVKIRKKESEAKKLYLDLESDQQQTLAMLAATEKVADLPLWRSAKARSPRPVPGVDVVRSGEHPEPMFDEDPQGLRHANFKPLR